MNTSGLETSIGYAFRDRNLLEQALVHRSYANERTEVSADNERLEFLGDAVLAMVVAALLYRRCPLLDEGELSRRRSTLVCAETLVKYARQIGLGRYLRLGKGEEASGGRDKPTLLADAFEAVIGAVYLDSDVEMAAETIRRFVLSDLERMERDGPVIDFKSRLQEALQSRGRGPVRYRVVAETGPDHEKVFSVAVAIDDQTVSSGTGRTRKLAEQAAAEQACSLLGFDETVGTRRVERL
jgi:ribonuclease III